MKDYRVVECLVKVEGNEANTKITHERGEQLPAEFLEDGITAVLPFNYGLYWAIIVGRKDEALFELYDITLYGRFEAWARPVRGKSRSEPLTDFLSYTVSSFRGRRRRH